MKLLPLVSAIIIGSSVVAGCSSSSSSSTDTADAAASFTPYERVAPLAAQTATITIADPAGTPVVTITTQPANITLAAIATIPGANSLDVAITATNASGRILFNLKAIMDDAGAALNGSTVSGSTGTIGADNYVFFGTKAVADAASADAEDSFTFDTTGTMGSITFDVTLPTQDIALYSQDDTGSGAREITIFDTGNTIAANDDLDNVDLWSHQPEEGNHASLTRGVSSPDGQFTFFGHKQGMAINVLNNTTHELSEIPLRGDSNETGYTDAVVMSPNGQYLYASLHEGTHGYDVSSGSEDRGHKAYLVKVDASSMEVVSKLDITSGTGHQKPKNMSISADGSLGALAMHGLGIVYIVDLAGDMAIQSSVDVSSVSNYPQRVAMASDAEAVIVSYFDDNTTDLFNPDGDLTIIDLKAANALSNIAITTPDTNYRTRDLRFGPDGRLYYLRDATGQLSIFDFTTGSPVETEISSAVTGASSYRTPVAFGPYGDYYYVCSNALIAKIDITDDTLVSSTNAVRQCYHGLTASAY
jgi:WD40 repeat protein